MVADYREGPARFYDAMRDFDDLDFYLQRVTPATRVLELGCGTGWVTLPLAARAAHVHGVDHSPAMLARARAKQGATDRVRLTEGDITSLDLGETFDLVIAPFRVLQNLVVDEHVDGLFDTITRHLAPRGLAIINAFNPNAGREELIATWSAGGEVVYDACDTAIGRVRLVERRVALQEDPLVLFPQLRYELLDDSDAVTDSAVLDIAARVYYPEEFLELFTSRGLRVVQVHGGYHGERYGEGPELVVEFERP